MAFGLGVLGIIMGIAFFIWSQKPCSVGESFGRVREPGTRVPVWVCRESPLVWGANSDRPLGVGPVCSTMGLHPAIWGPYYTQLLGTTEIALSRG